MPTRTSDQAGGLIAQHNWLLRLAARGFSSLDALWITPAAYRRHLKAARVSRLISSMVIHRKPDFDRLVARNLAAILSTPMDKRRVDAVTKFVQASSSYALTILAGNAGLVVQSMPGADVGDGIRLSWASPWRALLGTLPGSGSGFKVPDVAVLVQAIPKHVTASGVIRPGRDRDTPDVLVALGSIAGGTLKRLRTAYGRVAPDVEVEWLLADRLYVLNARRVESKMFTGIPISPGTARGVARLVRTTDDAASLQATDVIVSSNLIPELTPCVPRVAGVVIEAAGSTSHAAIVARQFGVPAVFGVRGIVRSIGNGAIAMVDGTRGVVVIDQGQRLARY